MVDLQERDGRGKTVICDEYLVKIGASHCDSNCMNEIKAEDLFRNVKNRVEELYCENFVKVENGNRDNISSCASLNKMEENPFEYDENREGYVYDENFVKIEEFNIKDEKAEAQEESDYNSLPTAGHLPEQKMQPVENYSCSSATSNKTSVMAGRRHKTSAFKRKWVKSEIRKEASKMLLTIKWYQCDMCPYKTKMKHHLKYHMIIHKDPSETVMFKCETCMFQTRHKRSLRDHMVTHRDPSKITMYKCEICTFATKQKRNLRIHDLIHKDPSEIKFYECEMCTYKTKQKFHLNRHMLSHKDPSEISMYKCEMCPYKARQKSHLGYHILTHKDPSEVTMYKCKICTFETKRKSSLKSHMLVHKDLSDVTHNGSSLKSV